MARSSGPRIGTGVPRRRSAQELGRARELRQIHEKAARQRHEEVLARRQARAARAPSSPRLRVKVPGPPPLPPQQDQPAEIPNVQSPEATPPPSRSRAGRKARAKEPPTTTTTEVVLAQARKRQPPTPHHKPEKPPKPPLPPRIDTPLGDAAEAFYLDRQLRRCAEATIYGYRRDLSALVRWLDEHQVTEPGQITSQHVRQFLGEIDARKVSVWTLRHYAVSARVFDMLKGNHWAAL
jgi:hypothetical protein